MELTPQDLFRLTKAAKTLIIWDTESQGLNGDYGSLLVGSAKRYGQDPVTFQVEQVGNDKKMVREFRDYLNEADAWVTFYGKVHDVPLVNTRLLRWGLAPLDPKLHVDLFFTLKPKLRTVSKSQAHLTNFLDIPEKKMTVDPKEWGELAANFKTGIKVIRARCESDCFGLEGLFDRTSHLVRDIKRG